MARLMEMAGRFTFDPVPVLRRYLDGADRTKIWTSVRVFKAICSADPRWGERLTPLLFEVVRGLPPTPNLRDLRDARRAALDALNVQGQRAAWDDLLALLGPEITAELRPAEFGKARCR